MRLFTYALRAMVIVVALLPIAALSQTEADLHGLNERIKAASAARELTEVIRLQQEYTDLVAALRGKDSPSYAAALTLLGDFLSQRGRTQEAEQALRKALEIYENRNAQESDAAVETARKLAPLLELFSKDYEGAERLLRRILAIRDKKGKREDDLTLWNLSDTLVAMGRKEEAEPLMRRALAATEKNWGWAEGEHYNKLAILFAEKNNWPEAARIYARGRYAMLGNHTAGIGYRAQELARWYNRWALRSSARTLHRLQPDSAAAMEDGFELAQWSMENQTTESLTKMSARLAKGNGPLASLVREREVLQSQLDNQHSKLSRSNFVDPSLFRDTIPDIQASITQLSRQLKQLDERLDRDFQEYKSLLDPSALRVADTQKLLQLDQALVLLAHVSSKPEHLTAKPELSEETVVWVITKNAAQWARVGDISEQVQALRCGLDSANWAIWSSIRESCKRLLGVEASDSDLPPFDLNKAHDLYQSLLGPFAEQIENKHLLIVPSGPLSILPFQVLVTAKPASTTSGLSAYREAKWLAHRHTVTILPAVASMRTLNRLGPSQAPEPYIAFGNPLLDGDGTDYDNERAEQARAKQHCPQDLETFRQRLVSSSKKMTTLTSVVRGEPSTLVGLRKQAPLPETSDELCAVAKAMLALGEEEQTVWLGSRATEANLKQLSEEGKLSRYRILHFATHGFLASESGALKQPPQPALMLTPPADGRSRAELELDNGLLTASEVEKLTLDADWVVLSACNTAGGEREDAEALSGLARAFFYAGARSLLVSHWYVSSNAAVKIITDVFAGLRQDTTLSRAEALRRAMLNMIGSDTPSEAHPANWAPFALVGGGLSQ